MPIKTDLRQSPYFSSHDSTKGYVRNLWKPGVAVQTRELNELQEMIQEQIERMGNNLFKRGTIIDGVNFVFFENYPYIKLKDSRLDGTAFVPSETVDYFVKSASGLAARIVDYADGFENTDPDLKTLYLKYINSGNTKTDTAFAAGQILTVYDGNNSIFDAKIDTAGSGYSNTDSLVFTPVLLANVNSGTFLVGDTITDPATGSKGIVKAITDQSTRQPNEILAGTVAVTSSGSNVTGTGTTFTSDFANGDYITVFSNVATNTFVTKKINVVTNNTFMNLTATVGMTNATATYANSLPSLQLISYAPLANALSNSDSTESQWTFYVGNVVNGTTGSDLLTIIYSYGADADAGITTDASGRIIDVDIISRGSGYSQVPYVSVKSSTGTAGTLTALNYYGQITVSDLTASVGTGYAFGVTEGVIYQRGYFLHVDPQVIVVEKYSNSPNNVTVGFRTDESIINSNIDSDLLDNSLGSPNFNAPGADRLKLSPVLATSSIDSANNDSEFFNLVEWSNGFPYKQNNKTFYNILGDELASEMKDSHGDFVIDRFLVTTANPANSSLTANTFDVVVDPGVAYVDGYKVETRGNFLQSVSKAVSTKVATDAKVSLNYENYVVVNELGGFFEFDRANQIELYDTAKGFISNTSLITSGNTTPQGTLIGTARIRNLVFEQGTPGTNTATYRAYLFDVSMSAGKAFRDVRSLYYNGTVKGIADVKLQADGTTNTSIAFLNSDNNKLLFYTGFSSPLNANNIDYVYRTTSETLSIANTGQMVVSLVSSPGKSFPYTGTLSDAQKTEITLVPQANLVAFANATGTVNVASTSSNVLGNATDFVTQFKAGQYINIVGGASNNNIRRIVSITNSTLMTVDSNVSFTQTTVPYYRAWPMNAPIQLAYNSSITANVSGAGYNILTINLGSTLNTTTNTNVYITHNVEVADAAPSTKSPQRKQLVKLRLANNAATTAGPWCLGVPDIFRLRNVYRGNSSVSTASTNVTNEFFVDHNQTSNYYDLGYLYLKSRSSLGLDDDDYLLVEYDCFTTSPGLFTVGSYVTSNLASRWTEDSKTLTQLDSSSTINTFEIPELFDDAGNYYDLINHIDFRPYVDATANITSNTAQVTLNPANTVSFASTDRFFPLPASIYKQTIEYFLPRIDSVVLDKGRNIKVISGTDGDMKPPEIPAGSMKLNDLMVPPYPSVPATLSSDLNTLYIDKRVHSNKFAEPRLGSRKINTLFTNRDFDLEQPQRYTERDIGALERRIKDLEYYVAFSQLQASIKDRTIPSSISAAINRFKYGFFTDDYSGTLSTELSSPEFNAAVEDDFALPAKVAFNMVHDGSAASHAFTEVKLVTQPNATTNTSNTVPTTHDYNGGMRITPKFFKAQAYVEAAGSNNTKTAKSKNKIVCTAMNEEYGFGSFRQVIWLQQSASLPPEYELGYHTLFLPVVDFAYRSKHKDGLLAKFIRSGGERIARKRTADIWKQKRGGMDLEGRIYRSILEPMVYVVGLFSRKK